ncbi:MAG TPA: enolase C-terminal domain-like protein, partial [Ktedonobacteraceae bacterium]|nr:enolase C-terminal domain-like protein [Ktedonobacteraceae bacterium]
DTGIGVAAALQLAAASPEITLACGLATLDLLQSDLLQRSLTIRSGEMELPDGPGLGVQIDQKALQQYYIPENTEAFEKV